MTIAKWRKPIVVKHLINEHTPFDDQIIEDQLILYTDWLNYVKGINISVGEPINNSEPGIITVQYSDSTDWVGTCNRDITGVSINSAEIFFSKTRCSTPAEFAGTLMHEFQHALGIFHYNDAYSIMNDAPYMNYVYRGTCKREDFNTLDDRFAGPTIKYFPAVYDYGKLQDKCIFSIPVIEYKGNRVEMMLLGEKTNDEWIFTGEQIKDVPYAKSVCTIDSGVWTIPIRYMKHDLTITAEEIPDPKLKLRVTGVS